ncbi:MAG: MFS transporter [Lautropia sp.]|nr:MFS transporter [Lautropia sp.]
MTATAQHRLLVAQWTAFSFAITAYMVSFFHRVAPAALSLELQQSFQASATELGMISAVFFLVVMLMQIPTGILADTIGSRWLLTVGCLVGALGAFLFAVLQSVWVASLARALIGFGAAIPFVALLRLNASWFSSRQFATLSGLTLLFANLGSVLSTTPLQWASQWVSWRWLIGAVGLLTLVTGLLIARFVRNQPADIGLSHPDGVASGPGMSSLSSWRRQFVQVVKNPKTWPCFFVGFGVCGAFFTFSSLWAVPFLVREHGMTEEAAATHVMLMIVAHAVTALFLGRLSDRLGNRRGLLLALAWMYLLSWLPMTMPMTHFPGESYWVFIFQGMASTSYTLIWAVAKEVNDPASAGMAIGVVNTSMFLAAAVLQPVIGALIDHFDREGMEHALLLLGTVSGVGMVAGCMVTETHGKNIHPKLVQTA